MKVTIIHNGCEANLIDSEKAREKLLGDSFANESKKEDADVVVFHGCTFTQPKEDETKGIIQDLLRNTKSTIIVSGCFLKHYINDPRVHYIKNENLPAFLGNLKEQAKKEEVKKEEHKKQLLPFVAISKGCYGSCTFCSIKLAKGHHKSRPIADILNDIEERKDLDYIKLIGDEAAGYGWDIGIDLKTLVDAIIDKFPATKLKFSSLNVKLLKKYTDSQLSVFAYNNVIGNVHIPIQSASTAILDKMQRGYTIEEYVDVYNKLKSIGVKNLSGDIICGFPGETEVDHHANIRFITDNKFAFMEVFAYQEREGTKAATFAQIEYSIRENRAAELIAHFIKGYSKWHNISIENLVKKPKIYNTNIKLKIGYGNK